LYVVPAMYEYISGKTRSVSNVEEMVDNKTTNGKEDL
jgi:hypothetical protein